MSNILRWRTFNIWIIWLIIIYRSSYQISIQRQKGTYSNFNLCKNKTPIHELPARSLIECYAFCQILLLNDCLSFKYLRDRKLCSLYDDVIRHDFTEFANGSCIGYQIMPGCYGYVIRWHYKTIDECHQHIKIIKTPSSYKMILKVFLRKRLFKIVKTVLKVHFIIKAL